MIEETPITRRRLIALGGGVAAAASVPSLLLPGRAAAAGGWLQRSTYDGRIGEVFTMRLANGSRFYLKLESVTGSDKQFDLRFHPTSSVWHDQATRPFSHPQLGAAQLFVVPSQPPKSALKYVVSVNRAR